MAFLLAEHRGHVEVMPTGRRGRYLVTPRGHVGVLVAPGCRLVIRPKVPLGNLLFLLDPLAPVPAAADRTTPGPAGEVLDFLAGQLAGRMAERAAHGLHRAYRERAAQGPFLQGRLDLPAQLRAAPGRKDQLHSRHDEWTADLPCNGVVRAVAERLLAGPLVVEEVRAALVRALGAFDGVRPVPPAPEVFAAAGRSAPAEYGPLLDLCRLLAEGLAPGPAAGPTPAPAFLLDMERVFERHLTRGVRAACAGVAGLAVAVQQEHTVNRPVPGRPDVAMRPDVTLDRAGRPQLVVDAKWKRPPSRALVTADLYQVLAYCAGLGCPAGWLVYPGRRDRTWEYTFTRTSIRIVVRTLRVTGGRDAVARALRRLGHALRQAVC